MEHSKNVRSPSLIGGNSYIMKVWGKTPVYSEVNFIGFLSGANEYKAPNKQLKDMTTTDFYRFKDSEGVGFKGKMLDNCLVHESTESRITFFDVVGASTVVKAAKAPVAKKAAKVAKAPALPVETPEEAKRRVANERKRNKRAADKAAKEAAANTANEAAAADVSETVTEQVPAEEFVVADSGETVVEAGDDDFGSMPELANNSEHTATA
jgi:hypothetical protein